MTASPLRPLVPEGETTRLLARSHTLLTVQARWPSALSITRKAFSAGVRGMAAHQRC